jgi:tryptophanase
MIESKKLEKAKEIVAYYTLAASVTGAIPVPTATAAIVGQNGIMFAHIASELGAEITVANVVESIGIAGTLNIAGRALFIDAAKLASWGTASVWALAALSALGASTAGIQTYILGRIAIEIAKNGGKALTPSVTSKIIDQSKETYDSFVMEWKDKTPAKPK